MPVVCALWVNNSAWLCKPRSYLKEKEYHMAVSLQKGGSVSLSKEAPGLSDIVVGLGWDPRATDGTEFDLDAPYSCWARTKKS